MKNVEPNTPELSLRFRSVYRWVYSQPCTSRKVRPSSTVTHMKPIVLARWLARSAWWAMVSVTPELSSSAVLIVGSQNGPTVWKGSTMPAGEAVAPAAMLGQTALKSGQSMALSRLPRAGTECARAHHSAVKKAPKNITSEKMNQLMLQRYDSSILCPYRPDSLSRMASPNHWYSTNSQPSRPATRQYLPQSWPLIHWLAPRMAKNRPAAGSPGGGEWAGPTGDGGWQAHGSTGLCRGLMHSLVVPDTQNLGIARSHDPADQQYQCGHQQKDRHQPHRNDVQRIELFHILLVIAALAQTNQRPSHCAHRAQQ